VGAGCGCGAATSGAATSGAATSGAALLAGVPLGAGAVLLLPAHPDHDDLRAIHAAARPLLDLLADRGLLDTAAKPVGPTTGERLSEAEQECPT
jgi:hypothetical protein